MSIKNDRGDDGNVTMLQLRMTITTPQDHWEFVFGGLVGSLALFWCFGHVSWMDDVWSKGKDRTVPFVWALNSSHSLRGNRCWQLPLFVSLLVSLSEPQSVSHISSFFVTSILTHILHFFLSISDHSFCPSYPPPLPRVFSLAHLSYFPTILPLSFLLVWMFLTISTVIFSAPLLFSLSLVFSPSMQSEVEL